MTNKHKDGDKEPILSQDEKDNLKAQALKEIEVENKEKASDEYKAQIKQEARKKELFSNAQEGQAADGLFPVYIDIPRSAENIKLDGRIFYPNHTYHVSKGVADSLYEIMGNTQKHEAEIRGQGTDGFYRKRRGDKV